MIIQNPATPFGAIFSNLTLKSECAEDLDIGEGLTGTYMRVRDGRGRTALHVAAAAGKRQICEYLIDEGILDVNVQDEKCRSPLHHAVGHRHGDIAEYLVSVGACTSQRDKRAFTPLHYAAEKDNADEASFDLLECPMVSTFQTLVDLGDGFSGSNFNLLIGAGSGKHGKLDNCAELSISHGFLYLSFVQGKSSGRVPTVNVKDTKYRKMT
ncbi:UNVERIFIED_CONTAM: hypothetical protein Sangu_0440100 [Sesamum angustifolium]|uniref:Uncharacterized protein n=1 Tax=Sesamum angustifolium TaxID=2727405 RepID=A0AAW2QTS1_9LAMI